MLGILHGSSMAGAGVPLELWQTSHRWRKNSPGKMVTVCSPALLRSASASSCNGNGRKPRSPLSLPGCSCGAAGREGVPVPKLAHVPSSNSGATV